MTIRYLLDEFTVDANRITFKAHPTFDSRFLSADLFLEYDGNISLETIDNSILAIPFLLNVLPLVWLSNETYYIESLDAQLLQALEKIRATYGLQTIAGDGTDEERAVRLMYWVHDLTRHAINPSTPSEGTSQREPLCDCCVSSRRREMDHARSRHARMVR